jgi:biopolymer transport protein ExbD
MVSKRALTGGKENEPRMDMTPMIDVTFQLLIFFMCTIKFKTLEGKLSAYLPKDVGVNTTDAEPKEKVDIIIRVRKEGTKMHPMKDIAWSGDGPFRYGDDRVLEFQVGPKKYSSAQELNARLKDLFQADPERGATIDSLPGTVYEDVVAVLDQAIDAQFTDITFKGARADKALPQ